MDGKTVKHSFVQNVIFMGSVQELVFLETPRAAAHPFAARASPMGARDGGLAAWCLLCAAFGWVLVAGPVRRVARERTPSPLLRPQSKQRAC